jgi:hypothetical protein
MKLRHLLPVALAALAVPMFAQSARPIDAQSHDWGGYHWARQSNPFTLQIGNNLTNGWSSHLTNAVNSWNAGNTPVISRIVAGSSSSRKCSMVAGTTQVCNGTYGQNGWLGLASINISGTHITQGTAKMNDTYFNMSTYNNPNEKLHVMCQEVAHTFGLGHQSTDGSSQNSCMDYFSNTGANATSTLSTKPNQHDFDLLKSKYSHLDSTTTVANVWDVAAQAISRMPGELMVNAGQWGTPVNYDHLGRPNVFLMRLGSADNDAKVGDLHDGHHDGDEMVLTCVYWANEDDAPAPRDRWTVDQ